MSSQAIVTKIPLPPQQPPQQLVKRYRPRELDDSAMMKQIQATHSPDGTEFDVKPVLHIIEDILRLSTNSIIDGVINGAPEHIDTLEDKTSIAASDGMLEALAYIIQKISCEITCKCSGGGDAHATTMALLNTLSNHSWDAKVVISLAAFAAYCGEFWLVVQLYTKNSLAKSVALLKQLPNILEHSLSLKPQVDSLNKLIRAILDLTKCIVQFRYLPSQYIPSDTPPMSVAMAHIPTAVYWTIRSIVACATQIASLIGLGHEFVASTTEAWELSSLAHKVMNIHDHLKLQLTLCYQEIDEKKHVEAYHNLVRLFETLHLDNMKILKALINGKDDLPPLVDGSTKNGVHIEVLRRKNVLLLISDLDIPRVEIDILEQIYRETRTRNAEIHYEVVWLPIVDRSTTPWHDENQRKFKELQSGMMWYTVNHPSLIEPAVIRYIKEVWHFTKAMILVSLDPQGRVACPNAVHMLWIWANLAFPFTTEKEETLWKHEVWRLELLVDSIDVTIFDWITAEKVICLYGGDDIEWIRKFTAAARNVAKLAGIQLEMVYVGKSNPKEKIRKINETITEEKLSHCWQDLRFVWLFWARLESMMHSKMRDGKTVENDNIMHEVMTLLSFDGGEQGWAIFWKGSTEMARAKADSALNSMSEFDKWKEGAQNDGFVTALKTYLQQVRSPHHCNRLILPGITGGIPERVVCAECSRPMEKFFMYRCCVD